MLKSVDSYEFILYYPWHAAGSFALLCKLYYIRLQSFRNHRLCFVKIRSSDLSSLKTKIHVHPPEHLHVIMGLKQVVEIKQPLTLVIVDLDIHNCVFLGAHYDERQLDRGVWCWLTHSPLMFFVPLNKILKCYLLNYELLQLTCPFFVAAQYLQSKLFRLL